jgi:DNA-binding response OmpR family regulator
MALEKKIMLVDDDVALRQILAEQLTLLERCRVIEAGTGREALALLDHDRPEMMVLDVGLPDMDGRDLCKLLRSRGVTCPIIMLTGQDSDADTILGLESGANDYVIKPFRLNVLMARLRVQARQFEQTDQAEFMIGPYRFQPANRLLVHEQNQRKIRLTDKENAILRFLLRQGDQAAPRETLLGEVWGYHESVTTHTLETHIYRLRQKIEPDQTCATLLVTDPGGYRLVITPPLISVHKQ